LETQEEPIWVQKAREKQVNWFQDQGSGVEVEFWPDFDLEDFRETPVLHADTPAPLEKRIDMIGANTDLRAILTEGSLYKRDSTANIGGTHWRKRWCIIYKDYLMYWKTQQKNFTLGRDNPPKGAISLKNVLSVEPSPGRKKNVFKVVTSQMTHYLCADTEENMMKWIAGLVQTVCRIQIQEMEAESSSLGSYPTNYKDLEVISGYLHKRKLNHWKIFWMNLKGGVLSCFEEQGGQKIQKISLYKATLEEYESAENSFKINADGKSIILKAADSTDLHNWLKAILYQRMKIEEFIDSIVIGADRRNSRI